jgi:hypothetical protein
MLPRSLHLVALITGTHALGIVSVPSACRDTTPIDPVALYSMRELLGDLLLAERQPAHALKEYEASNLSTPNRLRGLYGAAKAAQESGQQDKAAT